jgi:hypothetical protein
MPHLLGLQHQSQVVVVSTTKAQYIVMFPIMNLLLKMREQDFKVICTEPYVYCKVFEDNLGTLELARLPKLHPSTKHIHVCYHHLC